MTFITAGYPTIADTVPLMLQMEKGGANIIELGVPFTDPLADGAAIQSANNVRPASQPVGLGLVDIETDPSSCAVSHIILLVSSHSSLSSVCH